MITTVHVAVGHISTLPPTPVSNGNGTSQILFYNDLQQQFHVQTGAAHETTIVMFIPATLCCSI